MSRVKIAEELVFFCFSFQSFFEFWAIYFQTSGQKTSKDFKTIFCLSRGTICAFKVFKKFWTVMDFLQKHLAWFSKFYLSVQSKNCRRISSFCFSFQSFFEFWAIYFQTSVQKTSKDFKTTFCVSTGTTCGFKNFQKFWTVLDFLQKPLAWFSKFYLRVRVKIAEETVFLFFFSEFFRIMNENFQTSGQKISQVFKTIFCVSRGTVCGSIFLSFESFRIFCRNFWHGSQNSIYVSRVKIAEKIVFFCFHFGVFSIFERKFSGLLAKKPQKFVKTTLCVSRGTICGLKIFLKVLNRFGFSAETFGMVLKILSNCPE